MPTLALSRRPQLQRLGLAGIGSAVLLVGIASPAVAATGVVIPLEPGEVILSAFPVESLAAMDPMADPNAEPVLAPVGVRYGGTITVDLPAELDDSAVEAQLIFDDNGDGAPEATYSSDPTDPNPLVVAGVGTGSITITLPVDDPAAGDVATLQLAPLTSTLSPAFTYFDPLSYELEFDAAADAAVTVEPELLAISQLPCDLSSATRCPFPTPVTAGSTVVLDLTTGSVLRELGITDLTGVQVALQAVDADGNATGAPVELTAQVSGSTAGFVVPAGAAAGTYGLVIAQETPSGGASVVVVELTVVAEETPAAVVPPAAAPTTPATTTTVVNAGLRSNTGVEVAETGSTGTVAVAAGAGMLLLAGVGGVAVARTRRRPAVEGGTCEA